MKIDLEDFRVPAHKRVKLDRWPTHVKPLYKSEAHYKELLAEDLAELGPLQRLLYAANGYALLLVFQGMDAAGKDGAISHVLRGINPQGCEVHSFKHPSANELDHDFLWRTTAPLPARGRIGVFNRSYYEEVLIARVHPEILRSEGVPGQRPDQSVWKHRFRSIVGFERHLHRNGTRLLKFFLHLSKEEQRKRFLERIDDPDKNWKFSQADFEERKFWNGYTTAYEDCLGATSTATSPWHVVPADDKYNTRLIVARVVIEALQDLDLSYPKVSREGRAELRIIRAKLAR